MGFVFSSSYGCQWNFVDVLQQQRSIEFGVQMGRRFNLILVLANGGCMGSVSEM